MSDPVATTPDRGTTISVVHPGRKRQGLKEVVGWTGFDQNTYSVAEDAPRARAAENGIRLLMGVRGAGPPVKVTI